VVTVVSTALKKSTVIKIIVIHHPPKSMLWEEALNWLRLATQTINK